MAFVVENGTGLSNATAYVSEADADAYVQEYYVVVPVEWSGITDQGREQHIQIATRWLDATFGGRFQGRKLQATQGLDFPRIWLYDYSRNLIPSDIVPLGIVRATTIVAVESSRGDDLIPNQADRSELKEKTTKVDVITTTKKWTGGASATPTKVYSLAEDLIREYLLGQGSGVLWRA